MTTLTNHKEGSSRHFFVVDAENIVGTPSVSVVAANQMIEKLEEGFPTFKDGHKVIATSHFQPRRQPSLL